MWNAQHDGVMLGWDTLFPFLLDQAGEENPLRRAALPSSALTLPKALREQTQRVAIYLESDNVLHALAPHPRVVTPFQSDIVVLPTLDRLTATLRASNPHDTQ